jgi:hypothetical protein
VPVDKDIIVAGFPTRGKGLALGPDGKIPARLQIQGSSSTPLIDGTAAVGTSAAYARADHVHPLPPFPTADGSQTFSIDAANGSTMVVANGVTVTPFGNFNNFSGLVILNESAVTGDTALVLVYGGGVVMVSVSALFVVGAPGAGKVGLTAPGGVFTLNNNQGAQCTFHIFSIRTRVTG